MRMDERRREAAETGPCGCWRSMLISSQRIEWDAQSGATRLARLQLEAPVRFFPVLCTSEETLKILKALIEPAKMQCRINASSSFPVLSFTVSAPVPVSCCWRVGTSHRAEMPSEGLESPQLVSSMPHLVVATPDRTRLDLGSFPVVIR